MQAMWTKRNLADLKKVVAAVAAGTVKWEVNRDYPFRDAARAYDDILQGHTRGKSVLNF